MDSTNIEKALGLLVASGSAAALAYVFFGPKSEDQLVVTKGLQNLGNTCFMNAILQALAANQCFASWISEVFNDIPVDLHEYMPMSIGVHQVLQALSSEDSESVHCPDNMIKALASHGWRTGGEEQDAHELFHIVIMALLHELTMWQEPLPLLDMSIVMKLPPRELPRRVAVNKQVVNLLPFRFTVGHNPLDGLQVSKMTCLRCQHQRPTQYSHFDSLSLSLPPRYWSLDCGTVPLSLLLHSFCRPETLEGVDCSSCARRLPHFLSGGDEPVPMACPQSNFSRQVLVGRLPRCLCLHVQRLYWSSNGMPYKSQTKVFCPEELDMAPYTHPILGMSLTGQDTFSLG